MKSHKLTTKFIITFVGGLLVVFFVLIAVFEITFRLSMNAFIKESAYSMQEELDASLTDVVNEAAFLYSRMLHSDNIALLNKIKDEDESMAERNEGFDNLVQKLGINYDYFNDVALILGDDVFSITEHARVSVDDCAFLEEQPNRLYFVGYYNSSVVVGICSQEANTQINGTFLFYLNERMLNQMCNPSSGAEGYSFIMRSDGLIISHEDANLVGRTVVYSNIYSTKNAPAYNVTTLDGQKSIIVTTQAETLNERYNFDCCIISVLDYDYYFGTFDRVVIIVIAVSFIMLAVAVVLAVSRAHKITQPITSLSESINATAEPTKEHVSVLPEGDELKQLEYNYDRMLDRIYDLVEKNKRDMQLQRKLELDSLQMQINPHFLYNTLDAISWMAKIKKQPEIDKLVMNLAKFFRLSLHKGDKFITVDEELQIVKHYLEIDKIRFPDRVSVHYEIDESVLQYKTLKLILQPIVENCLKYAFPEGGGNLWIRAYGKDENLFFEVQDDGVGFEVPPDILSIKEEGTGGYGLVNVNERIKLQYGEDCGLTVISSDGNGVNVIVKIKNTTNEE